MKPMLFVDIDGVVADFVAGYKSHFNRDAYQDDPFTIQQFCMTVPDFFDTLPPIDRGIELVDALKEKFNIVFLTTPMAGMPYCKRNKIAWIERIFGGQFPVYFSDDKGSYVDDEKSILIDDMKHNLESWTEAGGTAIDFVKHDNLGIVKIIADTFNDKKMIQSVKKQLSEMEINTEPTEAQKETGNYKKGDIVFKGMRIKIENPKGSIRFGWGQDGKKWVSRMKAHYGYIQGTDGADYDPVDCFIGDKLNASRAFIVNQGQGGLFDEHKVILGCDNIEEAEALYRANYKKDWDGLRNIVQLNTKKLRDWLKYGNKSEPYMNRT